MTCECGSETFRLVADGSVCCFCKKHYTLTQNPEAFDVYVEDLEDDGENIVKGEE